MDAVQDLEAEIKDLLVLLAEIITRLLNSNPQSTSTGEAPSCPCTEDA